MRILLTGASGFIGRYLARALGGAHELICTVRSREQAVEGARTVVWDLSSPLPPELPSRVDAVVHAAQSRRYREFPDQALDVARINVFSTVALADYAHRSGARSFCLLSSGSVYEPFRGRLLETARLAPTSINGATKLAAEVILAAYADRFCVTALRLFFPYGPGQKERLIPDIIDRVRSGREITIAGRDGIVMTPILVDDVARVVRSAVEQAWTGTINVAGNEPITLRRMVADIARILGATPLVTPTPAKAPRVVPSIARLASRFDVPSFVSWDAGIAQMLSSDGTTESG